MSDRVYDLMEQAEELENGPEKVALIEAAVREADVSNDALLGYEARMSLIEAGMFGGFVKRAIVAFSWCLARFDESPEEYEEFDLYWMYKWVINDLPNFPTVSRQQILDMQDDLERRYLRSGYSLRTVHYLRADNALIMGDFEEAFQRLARAERSERDEIVDCLACEQSHKVWRLARLRKDEEAVQAAEPILAGKMSCTVVPESTYGYLVRPLLRLGRLEEALELYRKCYRKISRNPHYIDDIALHMLTLIAADDMRKVARLFEKHLPWSVKTPNLDDRFEFYNSSTLFLEKLAQQSRRKRKLNLPSQLPCDEPESKYAPAELANWFAYETQQLADQFNRRNGNEYYSELMAESRELAGLG